jgi:hypothetical protein
MTQAITEPLSHQQGEHTRSAVERIAAFAAAARPKHLTNDTRRLLKRNILDSLGCAIAALRGQPFQALREQFGEYRAPGRCTLIGGGKTSADQARRIPDPMDLLARVRPAAVFPATHPAIQ